MKEANTEPIKMSLEDLFQFALNIEEAAINPGKDSEGNPWNSKEYKTETSITRKQGGEGKNHENYPQWGKIKTERQILRYP
jgi:hypothetical protein